MKSTGMPDLFNVQVLADNVIPSIIGADGLEFTQVRTTAGVAVPQHEQQQQTAVAGASGRAAEWPAAAAAAAAASAGATANLIGWNYAFYCAVS